MKKSHKIIGLTSCVVVAAVAANDAMAQAPAPPAPEVREAMQKLAWLEGEWRGAGWYNTPAGRETYEVSEKAHFHLDGLILVVQGRGWSVDEDGAEIEGHKAFGVLSYDAYAKTYRFDAFVKEGYQSRSAPQVGENEFRWSHPAGPNAEMRYHARLSPDGEWIESGERCVAEKCTPVMEMRLSRSSPD